MGRAKVERTKQREKAIEQQAVRLTVAEIIQDYNFKQLMAKGWIKPCKTV